MAEAKAPQSQITNRRSQSSAHRQGSPGAISLIIVVVILVGLVWFFQRGSFESYPGDKWQAVFLANGQVYFGHVQKVSKYYVIIKDIYYLQVVSRPLQRSFSGDVVDQSDQQLTLIKLGNEIHGPEDKMDIMRDQVILVENLKEDSRVVEAITDYEENQ